MALRDTLSGLSGAVCLVYSSLPFDTAKLRLQTTTSYSGVFNVVSRMVTEEGVTALWKGAMPALSSALVENGTVFTVNGILRRTGWLAEKESDLTFAQHALLGAVSGLFSATAITPAEVVKCRMQYQRNVASTAQGVISTVPVFRNGWHCAMHIAQKEGTRGFFAGLAPLLLRDVPFNGLFFGSYRVYIYLLLSFSSTDKSNQSHTQNESHAEPAGHHAFLAGGLAGMTAWSVVFPADALKSRMQVHGIARPDVPAPRMVDTAKAILREGGVRLLYRGWSAAVMRAFPANAALFWGVETADSALRKLGI